MPDRSIPHLILGQLSDFPDGSLVPVVAGGRALVVSRLGDHVYVAVNRCPHRGLPLTGATRTIDDPRGVLRCPWHGSRFDVRTGAPVGGCIGHMPPAGHRWSRRRVRGRLQGLEQLESSVDSAGRVVAMLPEAQSHARSGAR